MPRRAELPNIMPARLDLDVYRRDSLHIRLQLRAHGRPVSLIDAEGRTDWLFTAYVRKAPTSIPYLMEIPVVVVDYWAGVLSMALPEDQVGELPKETVWDLQSQDPSGRTRTLLRGWLRVVDDVTYEDPRDPRRITRG